MHKSQTLTVKGGLGQGANRMGQLPMEIEVLGKCLSETQDLMSDLENRVECVCHPDDTPEVQKDARPEELLAGRAQEIRVTRYGLERINLRIRALLNRLEV